MVLVRVADDEEIHFVRASASEELLELFGDRRMTAGPPVVARVGPVDQDGGLAELAEDRVAILLVADVEEVDAESLRHRTLPVPSLPTSPGSARLYARMSL